MMASVFVKPREGARIRQPERNGRVMPDAGDLVPRDVYYERLLISGDIVESEPPQTPPVKSQPEPQPAPAPEMAPAARSKKD